MKAENFWQAIRDKIKHLIEADDLMGPDTIETLQAAIASL